MINLTVAEIINLQERLIRKTGGLSGVRDIGMLESAVYSSMQSFGEEDVYPTPVERAARLAFALTMNHPFLDGNKRIGMLTMLMTLKLNHVCIQYTQQELIDLGLAVANGKMKYDDILRWINAHRNS
ncbi:type II toxin-antitoxin system death-on-curing family toxin [Clostridium sp. D33t1_170424_F3]|uniref:type II toxin-antitoxin system death-on-curing family toxin n=1 Tax=Clostridium sp. D33t1_170424_F3 TaxID=2787099 RepID=UPI0018A9F68C|nr:type II toxin-antitoxin system death-on-curing family toxin [Clostridium sp. D33t1_170424_F3]